MDVEVYILGAFFTKYGQVEETSSAKSKVSIATRYIILQVPMSPMCFWEIPDTLTNNNSSSSTCMWQRSCYSWTYIWRQKRCLRLSPPRWKGWGKKRGKSFKKEKRTGRNKTHKAMDKAKPQSVPVSWATTEVPVTKARTRAPPHFPTKDLPSPSTISKPHH